MVYRNEIAESGVGTIASDESASLATLHLQIGRGCQSDRSVCIGMDYNANIYWIVAGQLDGRKLNVINSFYVKFERHGWIVEAVYIGNPMRHDEKYLLINQTFAGKQRLMPFINRQNFQRPNCDRFLVSLLIPLYGRILDDNFAKKTKNRLTIR